MKLYTLLFGRSKNRMKPIMIDSLKKCEQYKDARENNVIGFHKIIEAEKGADCWVRKNATIKGSGDKTNSHPPIVGKNGENKGVSGYILKGYGFAPNT